MKTQDVVCKNAFELRELLNTIPDEELKTITILVDEDDRDWDSGTITAECYGENDMQPQITIVGPHL